MTKKKRMYAQNNPKIKKPAYNEDDFVFLKKDYLDLETNEYTAEFLKKGTLWQINQCGCSMFTFERNKDTGIFESGTITDGAEWCYIYRTVTDLDHYEDDVQGCVLATDLELYVSTALD